VTVTAIIRFLKNPYPEHSSWGAVVGTFDFLHHVGDKNQFPPYPYDSYRVVGEVEHLPRSWPRMPHAIVGSRPLWRLVLYLEPKGFRIRWKYQVVCAVYSNGQQYPIDVLDGWHQEAATQ